MFKKFLFCGLLGYALYLEVKYNNLVDEYNELLHMSKRLGDIDRIIINHYREKCGEELLED